MFHSGSDIQGMESQTECDTTSKGWNMSKTQLAVYNIGTRKLDSGKGKEIILFNTFDVLTYDKEHQESSSYWGSIRNNPITNVP